jgi:hypothetical protein
MILTREGNFPIETLLGRSVEVWDGEDWQITEFKITGQNQPVHKLTLHSGEEILATPYHTFILEDGTRVELKDLEKGQRLMTHNRMAEGKVYEKGAYIKGFLLGDGSSSQGNPLLNLYWPKYKCMDRLINSANEVPTKVLQHANDGRFTPTEEVGFAPETSSRSRFMSGLSIRPELLPWTNVYRQGLPPEVFSWDIKSRLDFLAGYFDSDGSASDTKNGFFYQVSSVSPRVLKDVQLLLKSVGIKSHFGPMHKAGKKDFGKRGGICDVQSSYRLTISQEGAIAISNMINFSRLVSFADRKTAYKVKPRWAVVKSVEFSHVAPFVYCCTVVSNNSLGLTNGLMSGNCAEIVGANFFCDLAEVHLNNHDPADLEDQAKSFQAAGLSVATLLNHKFDNPKMQYSRELDPIVGVSFTGLFDFFVSAFGVSWLQWWEAGRDPNWDSASADDFNLMLKQAELLNVATCEEDGTPLYDGEAYKKIETAYLNFWRGVASDSVWKYCDKNGLKRPNRCTTVQPAGTKSLLTNASPGWHPPKAQRFIRRITFEPYNPVALASLDMGYTVVPGQKDTDENGILLKDAFDPRVTEWLVEIPVEVPWANLPGADSIHIEKFSARAQFDFWLNVQNEYTQHNTSATIEFREHEIEDLADCIYEAIQNDNGYISAALLARFDDVQSFPRLPFEPIDRESYLELIKQVQERRTAESFHAAMAAHDSTLENGPQDLACSGTSCELKFALPEKPQTAACDLNFGDEADLDDCGCPTA